LSAQLLLAARPFILDAGDAVDLLLVMAAATDPSVPRDGIATAVA
jgi:hypothetical protein